MLTNNLGYPRIGSLRQLKKACENYWAGKISQQQLLREGHLIKKANWELQKEFGIDKIPSNDFSFYDQVLDMSLMVNAIPDRFHEVLLKECKSELDLYFAMARGYQKEDLDIVPLEMTKWFDTNYHYLVPEFQKGQPFKLFSTKVIDEFKEAKYEGIHTKPVLIGPVSYLLLGKEKEKGFNRIDLISNLLPVYLEILKKLEEAGADWIQLDEPSLVMDLQNDEIEAFQEVYKVIRKTFPNLKILVASYFGSIKHQLDWLSSLPICALHVDLTRGEDQLSDILAHIPSEITLSLGVVDGRNIWINDFSKSINLLEEAIQQRGEERVWISPSCSLIHVPCDLELETDEESLKPEIKAWMAFAKQKLEELVSLKNLFESRESNLFEENQKLIQARKSSNLVHNSDVKEETWSLSRGSDTRKNPFSVRKILQQAHLDLNAFPTTTIGSFPQTKEVRAWRLQFKKGLLGKVEYENLLKQEIKETIQWQEEVGLDVLVHGEYERNDMVEYFGEKLDGFAFTQNGWVQSYGSRCVKPPVIYGDVSRPEAMTVEWTSFAQACTDRLVKGMLTGPVTLLQWSFVRDDQPRSATALQIAIVIRKEVLDLENAGIKIIQIDEPAIREGLPLRKEEWKAYLDWAIRAFRISSSGVKNQTQIHTHMCYSDFNDIISDIAEMDADVITIECSRSQMELLDAFAAFQYPNDIGPGVYDIHSPRVPSEEEMVDLLEKAIAYLPHENVWVNPDCGLKTRQWPETTEALKRMVKAAQQMREKLLVN
ncbi:5-methyltetrahydropteroyltriglutamate--homocysteine S-methyltransferase [Algoriphagus sp. PAP.12]|uniref:5-methyltetrahydropteroyltriglutamate-- homocysteine S-methyltransferase n=1 Tax=Algoriphagus sp. PAP.12 TaxID=2996678 RepID=UPI00227A9C46|nr:5-methyltetrahydropteroyltriglutamate--homocysteine S-methyltransferase [Algoriphagus sp. PAP.12]